MSTRTIDKQDWQSYFDNVSKHLPAARIDIVVASLALGVQTEVRRTPLRGLSYDPREDAVDVLTEHLDHRIKSPKTINVEETRGKLRAIEIVDATGQKEIIELSTPLALPTD